jgi:DNA-directed RNA polymerase subunit N (RpoN/RPB10)
MNLQKAIRCFGCGDFLFNFYKSFLSLSSSEERVRFFKINNIGRLCCKRMLTSYLPTTEDF